MLRLSRNAFRAAFRSANYIFFALLLFTTLSVLYDYRNSEVTFLTGTFKAPLGSFWAQEYSYPSSQLHKDLFLDSNQCSHAFPDYDKEIRDAVARGPFVLERRGDNTLGVAVQGRIKDGQLYIISAEKHMGQAAQQYRDAALQQLYRAILTRPPNEPIPDTHFAINVNDNPRSNIWSFSRNNDFVTYPNQWVMPHFSYWSWPFAYIQTQDTALSRISALESLYSQTNPPKAENTSTETNPWLSKIDKIVWRGTPWFNPITNTNLRKSLLKTTKNKEWADVKSSNRGGRPGKPAEDDLPVPIAEFCRYRYIAYAEGITYSGRLPFHQACASVVITPPIGYLQHTSFLIKPIWSSDLLKSSSSGGISERKTLESTKKTMWPISYPVEEANMVFVKPDWSDLEATVLYLREHPDIAERIGTNSRNLMVDGGYLSNAAEVCYWRALIRGWSQMARPNETEWGVGLEEEIGMRWEVFSLTGRTKWESEKER